MTLSEEKLRTVVEGVLKRMADKPAEAAEIENKTDDAAFIPDVSVGELTDIYDVKHPENEKAFRNFKKASPSRIGIGNAGARYLTKAALRFEADAATANDAVRNEMPPEFIEELGMFEVKTQCTSKEEFLKYPERGRVLDDEAVRTIDEKCVKKPQVQIFLSDGHSSGAIMANAKSILPTMTEALKDEGISVGTPFFVRFGRVAVEDQIAEIIQPDVIVDLIGERPALASSQSMSAYIAYRPTVGMVESNRTVVSNISRLGTPPVEAGAHIADLIELMLKYKTSGTALAQMI